MSLVVSEPHQERMGRGLCATVLFSRGQSPKFMKNSTFGSATWGQRHKQNHLTIALQYLLFYWDFCGLQKLCAFSLNIHSLPLQVLQNRTFNWSPNQIYFDLTNQIYFCFKKQQKWVNNTSASQTADIFQYNVLLHTEHCRFNSQSFVPQET